MKIQFKTTTFQELTTTELYDILQLRSEVFVVEQNCVYQDIDYKDQKAKHILGYYKQELVAYCRLFDAKQYFENASIGRVIVKEKYRKKNYGNLLIDEAIKEIFTLFNKTEITISAQLYLQKFYEKHGFYTTSSVYLEDEIPHIEMQKKTLMSDEK
jgi:ElaA protein